jgi:hypothetical protein
MYVCVCVLYAHARHAHYMSMPFVYKVGTICHSNLMQCYSVHSILLYSFSQFMTIVQRHTQIHSSNEQ